MFDVLLDEFLDVDETENAHIGIFADRVAHEPGDQQRFPCCRGKREKRIAAPLSGPISFKGGERLLLVWSQLEHVTRATAPTWILSWAAAWSWGVAASPLQARRS